MKKNPSSFRDPAGYIYHYQGKIYRTINITSLDDYRKVKDTGLLADLIENQQLIESYEIDKKVLIDHGISCEIAIEHKKLPFISYPYEWSFAALKEAAKLQLSIHLKSLEKNITLIDATPYNIQFQGSHPVFIDILSFRPYIKGDIWWGHRQFCEQYLSPLLLTSYCAVPFQDWYRGSIQGISVENINKIIPWHKKLSLKVLTHITLQSRLQKKDKIREVKSIYLTKKSLMYILISMLDWIDQLKFPKKITSIWKKYALQTHYNDLTLQTKKNFIAEFCQQVKPQLLCDIGCNLGEFAEIALKNQTAQVIGLDNDPVVVNMAFHLAQQHKINFFPLYMDFSNPSPATGWAHEERFSFLQRSGFDALFALAIIHHLRISNHIPLENIISFLLQIAPQGIIEFVPKEDAMVKRMLMHRKDIFFDYNLDTFLTLLTQKVGIIKIMNLPDSFRTLIWYAKHP